MVNTNTINITDNLRQTVRIYVNRELFIDQVLPFQKNKLQLTYNSDDDINKIRVKCNETVQTFKVSSNEVVDVELNK